MNTRWAWVATALAVLGVAALTLVAASVAVAAQQSSTPDAGNGQGIDENATEADGTLELSGLEDEALAVRTARSGPSGIPREPGRVTVTVRNTGDEPRTEAVRLYFLEASDASNESAVDRTTVTVQPNATRTVELQAMEALGQTPGTYTLRARAGGATTDATYRIYRPGDTYFTLQTVAAAPVERGEGGTVAVRVTHAGTPPESRSSGRASPGLATVVASVDGRAIDARTVWLDVGEAATVELDVPADVRSADETRVEVGVAAEHDRRLDTLVRPSLRVAESSTGGAGPGVGVVVALLAALLAVLLRARAER